MQREKMPDQSDISVQNSLDRLLLCNQIRELADYSKPVVVTDLSLVCRLLARIAGLSLPGVSVWRRTLIYPFVIALLRLLLYRWRIRHFIPSTLLLMYRKVRSNQLLASEITGYVSSTDKERPLVRVCLLLRGMGHYGACIEFLMRRFNSELPAVETRHWLSFFLREVGDIEAADIISPATSRCQATELVPNLKTRGQFSQAGSKSARLKYGIVVTTMFNTEAFRSSLLSLLGSDFPGEIVVVEEGHRPEQVCQSFCQQLPVKYVKSPEWVGNSGTVNLGIECLASETDIVIWAHNDLLWPRRWFGQLYNAWERVYDLDKVGIIHLGHMQFVAHRNDAALYELFVSGRYDDLIWVLKAMRNVPSLARMVKDVQSEDMGRLFGLARDEWDNDLTKLHMMVNRFSVAASFPRQTWQNLGGFDPNMELAPNMELLHYCFQNRKWNLWVNNTPFIHMRSQDFYNLTDKELESFLQKLRKSYESFQKKYGWEIEHLLFTYFAETSIIYHDEIVNAASESRFSDIDFVFDDFWDRLRRKKLDTCEIFWCNSRASCSYV